MITIFNYCEHERVRTKIVIVRGSIEETHPLNYQTNLAARTVCVESKETRINYPITLVSSSFVTVLELWEGDNAIQFYKNGDVQYTFHLTYEGDDIDIRTDLILKPLLVLPANDVNYDSQEESYFQRIKVGLLLMQTFFSDKMFDTHGDRRSFVLGPGEVFNMSLSKEQLEEMSSEKVWESLGGEIMRNPRVWNEDHKYVAFLSQSLKRAIGGGGLALVDFDFLSVWPENSENILNWLEDPTELSPEACRTLPDFCELYGASLGQVAHELGHLFELGHSDFGLMGTDFHRFSLFLRPSVTRVPSKSAGSSLTPVTRFGSYGPRKVFLSNGEVGDDVVQLTETSAKLLFYNAWFQNHSLAPHSGQETGIELDRNKITSTFGLTTIEIRDSSNGKVLSAWAIKDKVFSFKLCKRDIPLTYCTTPVSLIVQNEAGHFLHTTIQRHCIPESVTVFKGQKF